MELKKGEQLQGGKYKIIRVLGQGGFGITYEAEQVSLNRVVAIKEFFMKDCCERAAGSSHMTVGTGIQQILVKKFRDKFIKEVKLMASMNHRNIVRVFDVFEENGTAYYVMEKLSGGSLASLVQQNGPLPEKQAEIYIRQIAEALSYIHAYNTVHLDVKPSNILMNAEGDAVLIDFGTSKHYDEIGDQTSTTPVGFSRGFAPLEQYRDGDVSQFKPSTDIYALGATLYFMVAGSVPPEASVVNEEGLALPTSVSERMRNVITKSMCPKRKDRPQDIQEFKELWNGNIDGGTTVLSSSPKVIGGNPPIHEDRLQVYEEYALCGPGPDDIIAKNPLEGLFLHETVDPLTNQKKCWYGTNGQRCSDFFQWGNQGCKGFLLRADNFFYVIPKSYLSGEPLKKWDISFGVSHGYGIDCTLKYRFPIAHWCKNKKPFDWEGVEYPYTGELFLIDYVSDSFVQVIVVYNSHAVLLSLQITRYSAMKKVLLDSQGKIFAREISRIERD